MRILHDRMENYGEFVLAYDDQYGETEWIYTADQLCERVGCHCAGAEMICTSGGTRLYNPAIAAIFIDLCTSRCRCEPEYQEPPEPVSASDSDTDSTWSTEFSESESGSYYFEEAIHDRFADTIARLRAQYDHGRNVDYVGAQPPPACVPNRLQQCDSCLAGQAAGFTWKQSDCCDGYSLQQLTPQEAFTEYGLPSSLLITSHATFGICLKG
ncbi:MAG: hypothetical protein Q9208_004588 [Pyrenodesmia sp. 3 TL-2023]